MQLRDFSSLALKISREADCTTFGQPAPLWAVPRGKKQFFFMSILKLCCFNICQLSLVLRVWPCLPNMQGYRQEMANLNFPQSLSCPGRTGSNPLALLAGQVVQFPQHPGGPLLGSLNPGTGFPELETPAQRTQYLHLP